MTIIPGVIPEDNLPIIVVDKGHCIVARYRQVAAYKYEVERAANWPALENDACAAVEAQVGAITEDGHFPCPPELAARAVWP